MDDQEKPERDGVRCPKCHCCVSRVYYIRAKGGQNRRVRICGSPICGHKYLTKESVAAAE